MARRILRTLLGIEDLAGQLEQSGAFDKMTSFIVFKKYRAAAGIGRDPEGAGRDSVL